jgi:hypothetical protein
MGGRRRPKIGTVAQWMGAAAYPATRGPPTTRGSGGQSLGRQRRRRPELGAVAHEIKISARGGGISCNPGQREGFRSIENKKNFLRVRTRTNQDLIYEMQNNEREILDLHTLVDRKVEIFK